MSSHRHDATHLDPDEDRGDEVMDTQLATQTNNAPFVSKTIWNEIIGIIVREQIQTEDHVQMRTVFFFVKQRTANSAGAILCICSNKGVYATERTEKV